MTDQRPTFEDRLQRALAESAGRTAPSGLEDRLIARVSSRRTRGRARTVLGGTLLLAAGATVAGVAVAVHLSNARLPAPLPGSSPPAASLAPRSSGTPASTSTPGGSPSATPASPPPTHLTLTGAVSANQTIANVHIECGSDGVQAPVQVQMTIRGVIYWLRAYRTSGGALTLSFRNDSSEKVWTSGGTAEGVATGITGFDPDRGMTVHSTVVPDQSFASPSSNMASGMVHISGDVYCPAPGSPSRLSLSGAIAGQMAVTHVSCDTATHVANPSAIRAIIVDGSVNGSAYVVYLQTDNNALTITFGRDGSGGPPAGWSGPAKRGSTFDATGGAAIQGDLPSNVGGQGFTPNPSAPHLDVAGVVTCPA